MNALQSLNMRSTVKKVWFYTHSLLSWFSLQRLICFAAVSSAAVMYGCGGSASRVQQVSEQVALADGAVQGSSRDAHGVLAFKGIPYAAAPVSKLRWKPPQAVQSWQGVRAATAFGPRCEGSPLLGAAPPGNVQSEDCLTLNVWTAAQSTNEKRPVMVWIHGGGFQTGVPTPSDPSTDGGSFAAKGVVLVSFNYRLGVFGFLSHPALDSEGTPSGDYGLQDQIAALKWVRSNIARFGGDPNNVTIFGESAGAMSVGLLMSSPLATGLFHKAIGESGAFQESEHGSIATRAAALERGQALAARLTGGNIAALRAISADELLAQSSWSFQTDPVTTAFSPSVDGYVLPDCPANIFSQGKQNDVPLLAGRNGSEGYIFLSGALPYTSSSAFQQAATVQFGTDRLTEFLSNYPANTDTIAAASAETLVGDLRVSEQSWEWMQLQRQTGRSPVYGYQFNYHSEYSPMPIHGADISFVFGTLMPQMLAPEAVPDARDREVSGQLMSYWVNFARNGDPNGTGLPRWPAYQGDGSSVMLITDLTTVAAPETDSARFRFLRSFRKNGRMPDSWRQTG